MRDTLTSSESRGNFLTIEGMPTAEQIVSYFWSPARNLRPLKDAILAKRVLSQADCAAVHSQLTWESTLTVVGVDSVDQLTALIAEVNDRLEVDSDDIRHYAASGGTDGHIDYVFRDGPDNKIEPAHKCDGIVGSLGIVGNAILSFSPVLKDWIEYDDPEGVFTRDGSFPAVDDMRTALCQEEGDLVVIRPGIVHAVEADTGRIAIQIAQNNHIN